MSHRTPQTVRTALVLLGALALVATSCGGGSADTAVQASVPIEAASPAATEAAAPAETADVAPAEASLVGTTVSGGQIDFASLEGQDVVLWFWAPW